MNNNNGRAFARLYLMLNLMKRNKTENEIYCHNMLDRWGRYMDIVARANFLHSIHRRLFTDKPFYVLGGDVGLLILDLPIRFENVKHRLGFDAEIVYFLGDERISIKGKYPIKWSYATQVR